MKTKSELESVLVSIDRAMRIVHEHELATPDQLLHWGIVRGVLIWTLGKAGGEFDAKVSRFVAAADQVLAEDRDSK